MSDDLVQGAAWSLNTLTPLLEKQQAENEKLRCQVEILQEGLKRLNIIQNSYRVVHATQ